MTKPKPKITTLSERAMLVNLQISQWTARKLNRAETTALNRSHGLTVEAARVNVNLLPFATTLERVHQTTGAIRKDFDRRTLPWQLQGVNILKAESYNEFISEANQWRSDWDAAVEAFFAGYDEQVADAKVLLNGLFNPDDYPAAADLRRRFAFNIRFMPVPDKADWRVDVGDEATERLRDAISRQVAEAEAEAMQAAWKRVYEVVERAVERLSSPDAVFRDTLVENAAAMCRLLPSLNLTNDPDLERTRQAIEGSLCKYNADTLRSDPLVRADVAAKMADIQSKMGAFFTA